LNLLGHDNEWNRECRLLSFKFSLPLIQVIDAPQPVSRDLSLAYGVLGDTADGMKLLSVSDALDALASGRRHESFFTDEWSFDGEALRGDDGEPFAVFGCREQQFKGIDIDRYDGYTYVVMTARVFSVCWISRHPLIVSRSLSV